MCLNDVGVFRHLFLQWRLLISLGASVLNLQDAVTKASHKANVMSNVCSFKTQFYSLRLLIETLMGTTMAIFLPVEG